MKHQTILRVRKICYVAEMILCAILLFCISIFCAMSNNTVLTLITLLLMIPLDLSVCLVYGAIKMKLEEFDDDTIRKDINLRR